MVLFVVMVVAAAWAAAVYGLRVRDGAGDLACALTSCSPGAIALCGLAASLIPAAWCTLYAVLFGRLKTGGRVLGAAFTCLLLLSTAMFWTSHRRRYPTVLATTEHAHQFAHGVAWGLLALVADFVLVVPALVLAHAFWTKQTPKAIWIDALATPIALAAIAAMN